MGASEVLHGWHLNRLLYEFPKSMWQTLYDSMNEEMRQGCFVANSDLEQFLPSVFFQDWSQRVLLFKKEIHTACLKKPSIFVSLFESREVEDWSNLFSAVQPVFFEELKNLKFIFQMATWFLAQERAMFLKAVLPHLGKVTVESAYLIGLLKMTAHDDWATLFRLLGPESLGTLFCTAKSIECFLNQMTREDCIFCVDAMRYYLPREIAVEPVELRDLFKKYSDCEYGLAIIFRNQIPLLLAKLLVVFEQLNQFGMVIDPALQQDFCFLAQKTLPVLLMRENIFLYFIKSGSFERLPQALQELLSHFQMLENQLQSEHIDTKTMCNAKLLLFDQFFKSAKKENMVFHISPYLLDAIKIVGIHFFERITYYQTHAPQRAAQVDNPPRFSSFFATVNAAEFAPEPPPRALPIQRGGARPVISARRASLPTQNTRDSATLRLIPPPVGAQQNNTAAGNVLSPRTFQARYGHLLAPR